VFAYECFRFNGSFYQRLPDRKFNSLQDAENGREFDLSMGVKCYSIVAPQNVMEKTGTTPNK
jgi:hypothetical protein